MMIRKGIIILLTLFLSGCGIVQGQEMSKDYDFNEKHTYGITSEITASINLLGYDLTKAVDDETNLMVSPLSLSAALAILANGTAGTSQEEVLNLLNVEDSKELNDYFNQLMSDYDAVEKEDGKVVLANSCWLNKDFQAQEHFVEILKSDLNSDVYSVDFNKKSTSGDMNHWVDDKTEGLIKKIVDQTKNDDVAYLINALYFESQWINDFYEQGTKKKEFHLLDGSIEQVDMMYQNAHMYYAENENLQIVSKKYNYGEMVIVLPKDDFEDFFKNMSGETIEKLIDERTNEEVKLSLPKFKFDKDYDITEVIKVLGVKGVFNEAISDFSPMVTSDLPIVLSKAKQSVAIEVDEKGTKAAAVTALDVVATCAMPVDEPKVVVCDRPFMFMIKDHNGINMFHGVVYNPNN